MVHTTLALLSHHYAREAMYKKLCDSLPNDHASNTPIPLSHVLDSNGIGGMTLVLEAFGIEFSTWFGVNHHIDAVRVKNGEDK